MKYYQVYKVKSPFPPPHPRTFHISRLGNGYPGDDHFSPETPGYSKPSGFQIALAAACTQAWPQSRANSGTYCISECEAGEAGEGTGGEGGLGGTQPKGILLNSFNTCSLSNMTTREPQTLKQQPRRQRQISRPKWVGITVTLQLHIYTLLSTNLSANFRSFQGGQRARRAAEIKAVSLSREGHSAPSSVATPAFLRPHARRPRRGAGSLRAGVARGRPAAPGRDPRSRRPPRAPPWPRRFRA